MTRKKLTRIIVTALIISVFTSIFMPISVFAAEDENTESTNSELTADTDINESRDNDENDENFFTSLYLALQENATEILSALAFVGSLIIMFSYKKGFLPLITDGVKALASGVKNITDKTDNLKSGTETLCKKIEDRLNDAEELLSKMHTSLKTLEEKLGNEEENRNERAQLKMVLNAEIDMLYEIFMAAALPQYLKDNVGEKISLMKATLIKEAHYENEN